MKLSEIEELTLEMALEQAALTRFCPPDSLLFSKHPDKQLEKHISKCPACRERLEMNTSAWKKILESMQDDMPREIEAEPCPAQIWTMDSTLEGWDGSGRYINTPHVLLLDKMSKETFLAAQTYWDISLRSQGDVDLGRTFGFAQPWNIKHVPLRCLSRCLGQVDPVALKQTNDLLRNSRAEQTGLNPQIQSFRLQEQDIFETVVLRAQKKESHVQNMVKSIMEKFSQRFKISDIRTLDMGEILAHSSFTGKAAAMAAAAPEQIVANVVRHEAGMPQLVKEAAIELTSVRPGREGLLVAGRIPEEISSLQKVRVWWSEPGRPRIEADQCTVSGHFFQAVFPDLLDPDTGSGQPKVLIYTQ